jgi:hypothetical protein
MVATSSQEHPSSSEVGRSPSRLLESTTPMESASRWLPAAQ